MLWRRCRKACASLCRCEIVQQDRGDCGGHWSKPHGGVIQPGSWNEAGTHWLSVGKDTGGHASGIAVTAGARVTGGRTVNIVGMLAQSHQWAYW